MQRQPDHWRSSSYLRHAMVDSGRGRLALLALLAQSACFDNNVTVDSHDAIDGLYRGLRNLF